MNAVDASEHYERASQEQSPALLTIILDTNPGAWSLLSDTISLSSAVANLLVFVNAHLASNYTNKVAVVASHCNKAQWLYPSPTEQQGRAASSTKRRSDYGESDQLSETTKRLKINGSQHASPNGIKSTGRPTAASHSSSNKYRPFRLVEEELLSNLTALLSSTTPEDVSRTTSTKIAGALTLALSYINRETIAYAESTSGLAANDPNPQVNPDTPQQSQGSLQSRIFILTVSPTSDLAHQYIPIMNTIFACQRLSIPIDICQIPIPSPSSTTVDPDNTNTTTTVFLQQASDATGGIYILLALPSKPNAPPPSLLTYLMTAFLPSPSSRTHLILPTSISVDFRAACFCHRNIVDIGFVCSICLSIFCSVPENGDCLTCGTHLSLGEYGATPVVVVAKKKKKRREGASGDAAR